MHRYDVTRSELLEFVPEGARTILDVGCSTGNFLRDLRKNLPRAELWGIEPDEEAGHLAREYADRILFEPIEEAWIHLPKGFFDVVSFNDVLEHLVEPARALDLVRGLLSPTGVVLASIPNVRHRSVVWPLVRHGRWDYEEFGLLDSTHLRFFTRKTAAELFSTRGWRIVDQRGINRQWDWRPRRYLSRPRLVAFLERLSQCLPDEYFYVQYVFVARFEKGDRPAAQHSTAEALV